VSGDPRRLARALVLATNTFLPYALSPRELGDRRRLQRDAEDVIRLLVTALTQKSISHTAERSGAVQGVSK
jgi:hypothetical protein